MEAKLAATRHFFKVMLPGFKEILNLPPAFCEKLKQERSKCAIVKSRKGTWTIDVCRSSQGLICFKDGWPNFVHNHGLAVGDFVVFEHIGDLKFNVSIFDPTMCEKEFLIEVKEENEEAPEAVSAHHKPRNNKRKPGNESGISYRSKNPHFIRTMKPSHAQNHSTVTIPADLSRSYDIGMKSGVILRDPCGNAWPVRLSIQRAGRLRCRMYRGWHAFYVANKLKDGDICAFDLDCHSLQSTTVLMDVQIFRAPL